MLMRANRYTLAKIGAFLQPVVEKAPKIIRKRKAEKENKTTINIYCLSVVYKRSMNHHAIYCSHIMSWFRN